MLPSALAATASAGWGEEPHPCWLACGRFGNEMPYYELTKPEAPSDWLPCDPCREMDSMLDRLTGILDSFAIMLANPGSLPPWYPKAPRDICRNGQAYTCPPGTPLAGKVFIPVNRTLVWGYTIDPLGTKEPCVGRCIILHEFSHGIVDDAVRSECPAVIVEARCLLDYLIQGRCCHGGGEFERLQLRIRLERERLSQLAARCPT